MPTKLRNLKIRRVDLCDLGANYDPRTGEGAHILIAKAASARFRWQRRGTPDVQKQCDVIAEQYSDVVTKAADRLEHDLHMTHAAAVSAVVDHLGADAYDDYRAQVGRPAQGGAQ